MRNKYTQLDLFPTTIRRTSIRRDCRICGTFFYAKASAIKRGYALTCSRSCAGVHKRRERAPRITIQCEVCGCDIRIPIAKHEHHKRLYGHYQKYCSAKCSHASPEWKKNLGDSLRHSPIAKAQRKRALTALNADAHTPGGRARRRRQTLAQMRNPETRKAWEASIRKRTASPEWRASAHFQRGEKHPRFTGGRAERLAARNRYDYKLWRKSVFDRDKYTCQECGKKGGYLNAHHIKPWSTHVDLRYEVSNGITLCAPCHKAVHASSATE